MGEAVRSTKVVLKHSLSDGLALITQIPLYNETNISSEIQIPPYKYLFTEYAL